MEVRRDCRVKSTGSIDLSPTGYYSLDIFQEVEAIETVGQWAPKALFTDYSKAKPEKTIRKYRVDMQIDYEPGDHPIVFRVSSDGKEPRPWQAYASYRLTGGLVLYGHCGAGFVVDDVFGTPEAKPDHFDRPSTKEDKAAFDPESAAVSGVTHLHLGYTCMRKH
jgi:hypothetical protein